MRTLRLISTVLVISWSAVAELDAQSLADLAREERRRRAEQQPSGKVYTNDDLSKYGGRSKAPPPTSMRQATPPVSSESTQPSAELDEERRWSQRFIEAKAKVEAGKQRQKALEAKMTDLNQKLQGDPLSQTTVVDPANVYGPLIAQAQEQIQQNKSDLTAAQRELADLHEELRKSGKPMSWENSQAALRSEGPQAAEESSQEPKVKDEAYWRNQLALIDKRYEVQIAPLQAERFQLVHRRTPQEGESLAAGGNLGLGLPPRVIDIDIEIKELRQKQAQEKEQFIQGAMRAGALPGWFR